MTTSLPTLDQVLADPSCLAGLPPESLTTLLMQVAAAQTTVTARLVLAAAATNGNGAAPNEPDVTLSATEIAKALRHSERWVYPSAHRLLFLRRVGRSIVCSRRELDRYIAGQRIK